MPSEKPKFVRQVVMKDDGSLTDVPARDSERPQLEEQEADLFDWAAEQDRLDELSGDLNTEPASQPPHSKLWGMKEPNPTKGIKC